MTARIIRVKECSPEGCYCHIGTWVDRWRWSCAATRGKPWREYYVRYSNKKTTSIPRWCPLEKEPETRGEWSEVVIPLSKEFHKGDKIRFRVVGDK